MDDICDSVKTVEEAQKTNRQYSDSVGDRWFKVKGWITNKALKENDNEAVTEMKVFKGDVKEKILGTGWNRYTHSLSFKFKVDPLQLTHSEDPSNSSPT